MEIVLDGERGRWFLWLPVFFGCGIAIYLTLLHEPPAILAIGAVVFASALRIFLRRTTARLMFSSIALMISLGFLTAKLHALWIDAPVLQKTLRFVTVEGWVERVERQQSRTRLTLQVIRIDRLQVPDMPRRVRVSFSGKKATPLPGEPIRLRATLMPPPEPVMPGGFDFARYYWFKGIGASGYAMGRIDRLEDPPQAPLMLQISAEIGKIRDRISRRIDAVLQGDHTAIAKALTIGEKGELSKEARQALRDSGLAHVIAISGFHMALTAGALFWLIRAFLALIPPVALRFPIKTWAAIGALLIASIYLAVSGAAVSAIRAYIMVTIIFIAIILNRPAISLRNLAIAAFIILIVMPQSLLDAGFQMSFAATAALIAFYEVRPPFSLLTGWPRFAAVPLLFLIEVATTTLLASFAVDPFSAYHFHRVAVYSLLGNILAVPVIGLVTMPMALIALLAMPFGLESLPLAIMDLGIGWMLNVSGFIAQLPGASVGIARFSDEAFLLIVAGGLWLCIWRQRWRWLGLIAIGAGLALVPFGARPDIWIDREGKLVAIRDGDGAIATSKTRKSGFSLERWMEADGDTRPVAQARGSKAFQCDDASCIALVKERLVSYVYHPSALTDDCRRAAVLIANFPTPERCQRPEVVIDGNALEESGARMVFVGENSIRVQSVGELRGFRPWVVRGQRKARIPVVEPDKTEDPS